MKCLMVLVYDAKCVWVRSRCLEDWVHDPQGLLHNHNSTFKFCEHYVGFCLTTVFLLGTGVLWGLSTLGYYTTVTREPQQLMFRGMLAVLTLLCLIAAVLVLSQEMHDRMLDESAIAFARV